MMKTKNSLKSTILKICFENLNRKERLCKVKCSTQYQKQRMVWGYHLEKSTSKTTYKCTSKNENNLPI